MSGRLETGLRQQEATRKLLIGLPKVVEDYYYVLAASKEPVTCSDYIYQISILYHFLSDSSDSPKTYDITQITDAEVARYMQFISVRQDGSGETSFAHRKRVWSVLNNFFSYLKKKKLIADNPMELIERPHQQDNINRILLTEEEVNKLLNYIKTGDSFWNWEGEDIIRVRNSCIFTLMVCTGMRVTALSQIDCSDIDLDKGTISVIDKRHKTLCYSMNDMEKQALFKWLRYRKLLVANQGDDFKALFISRKGNRLSAHQIRLALKQYSKEALGYEITPHKLRAAFCSILYDKTKDIEFVREAVGHANSQVTQRYIVKKESAQKQASELLQNIFTS